MAKRPPRRPPGNGASPRPRVPLRLRLSAPARLDIQRISAWTEQRFGALAAERYRTLIWQALRDLRREPRRPGSRLREELGEGILSYHLALSRHRARTASGIVNSPRHFVIYFVQEDSHLVVLRLLHDASDLPSAPLA